MLLLKVTAVGERTLSRVTLPLETADPPVTEVVGVITPPPTGVPPKTSLKMASSTPEPKPTPAVVSLYQLPLEEKLEFVVPLHVFSFAGEEEILSKTSCSPHSRSAPAPPTEADAKASPAVHLGPEYESSVYVPMEGSVAPEARPRAMVLVPPERRNPLGLVMTMRSLLMGALRRRLRVLLFKVRLPRVSTPVAALVPAPKKPPDWTLTAAPVLVVPSSVPPVATEIRLPAKLCPASTSVPPATLVAPV